MTIQPTIFEITRHGTDRFHYRLRPPILEAFSIPTEQMWEAKVNAVTLDTLARLITSAADTANAMALSSRKDEAAQRQVLEALDQSLAAAGKGLFRELFPQMDPALAELRQALLTLAGPVLISTNAPDVHWELLFAEEMRGAAATEHDFIALVNDVGRRLMMRNVSSGVPRSDRTMRCLMIANPNAGDPRWDLPHSADEALQLCIWLENRSVHCGDMLVGATATCDAVLSKLITNEYDLIHFAGHVEFDASAGEFALKLNDGLLPASTIRNQVRGAPIVFLNGCRSGNAIEGLTDAFLLANAQAVVGSLFSVPDAGARAFAEAFYEAIIDNGYTIGAAMRAARARVRGKPEYAATWACFVLYGDPCLSLKLKVDELQRALDCVGLRRSDFDASSRRVIEQAMEYGRANHHIGTPHLFAALVGGDDPHLRDRLRQVGASPETLKQAFQEVFETVDAATAGTNKATATAAEWSITENGQSLLKAAKELAGKSPITERLLVKTFVGCSGSTGKLLNSIGVDVAALNPDAPPPPVQPPPGWPSIGSVSEMECTPEAWQALLGAAVAARNDRRNSISTIHLFMGLLQSDGGELAIVLSRLGALSALRQELRVDDRFIAATTSAQLAGDVQCSHNTAHMLELARELARADQRRQISHSDLLQAFVRQGGGETARYLDSRGLALAELVGNSSPPRALGFSPAFDSICGLRRDECDPSLWAALTHAAEVSLRRGAGGIGTYELFVGLLHDEGAALTKAMRRLGIDARSIRLALDTAAGCVAVEPGAVPQAIGCSENTVRIFNQARMTAVGDRILGDGDVLRAFVHFRGGSMGRSLSARGLVLEALVSELWLESGQLDRERFTDDAWGDLQAAADCAQRRGVQRFGRIHAVYAMLRRDGSVLRKRLGERGMADDKLDRAAESLFVNMPAGATLIGPVELRVTSLSSGLLAALCIAERVTEYRRVDDSHLVSAIFRDGGGDVGRFLNALGVEVSRLV